MPDHPALSPAVAEAAKLAALKRTKFVATGALTACLALFLAARAFQVRWPLLGFVAAFAEAATIGGLADWYAVVALFRRPLGLPIPHTAIIPSNQERIADNLGHFIEMNFLAPEPVRRKLEEVDFAALVADWLSERRRAAELATFVTRLVPQMLAAIEESGLKGFFVQRILDQLEKVQVAPLAADLLGSFTADRRHQHLFDELLRALGGLLNDERALRMLRERIRRELPTLANLFRADEYLLRKIIDAAAELIDEAIADPDHPLRGEFDRFVAGFVKQLQQSPEVAARAEKLKEDLLRRPELRNLGNDMWASVSTFAEHDVVSPHSRIRRHLADIFVEIGRQLAREPRIRADINEGFVVALASFVESQKSGVSAFISDQVRSWDLGLLTRLIELNIGRDLQYIRFNGMVIGGLAGLMLHTGEWLIFGT